MPKKFTDEEYAKMLPKKQVGTAVIFLNTGGEMLIVKPDYKEGWLVPGGSTDEDESPLRSALREVEEEIGLSLQNLQLAGIYYGSKKGVYTDSLKFVFYGGVLTQDQISHIQLQRDELEAFDFVSPEKAIPLLSQSLQKSIPLCLQAIKGGTAVYIESETASASLTKSFDHGKE